MLKLGIARLACAHIQLAALSLLTARSFSLSTAPSRSAGIAIAVSRITCAEEKTDYAMHHVIEHMALSL